MAIRPADQIIHKAAWLYYTHGLRQDQVAQQLNISRASVAMYLRKARETGIVNISTSTQLFTDDVLAREIEDAFGLDAVWIAPHGDLVDQSAEVPVLASSVFLELVKKGDLLFRQDARDAVLRVEQAKVALAGAQVNARAVETEYKRAEQMFQQNAMNRAQWEQMQSRFEGANVGVDVGASVGVEASGDLVAGHRLPAHVGAWPACRSTFRTCRCSCRSS